jgi:hypothetical protein
MKEASAATPLRSSQACFDLLAEIRQIVADLPITVTFFWVEGHQMERHGKKDYFGELNDICDSLAKLHWNEQLRLPVPVAPPSPNFWHFAVEGRTASEFDLGTLYDFTFGRSVSIPYWQDERHPMPDDAITSINWDAIASAAKYWPRGKWQWLLKHLAKFSATGRNMLRRKEWEHDLCPICLRPNEDSWHVQKCQAPPAQAQWLKSLDAFLETLKKACTLPAILDVLRSRMTSWMHDTPPHAYRMDELPVLVVKAMTDQDRIGWPNFMIGRISNLWTDAQDQWLVQIATRWKRSSLRWTRTVVQSTWEIAWDMWMHRNSVLHHPQHPWKLAALKTVDESIADIWSIYVPTDFLVRDQRLFQGSSEFIIKNYSLERKRQWMLSTRHARMRKTLYRTSAYGSERSTLYHWLHPPD